MSRIIISYNISERQICVASSKECQPRAHIRPHLYKNVLQKPLGGGGGERREGAEGFHGNCLFTFGTNCTVFMYSASYHLILPI